MDHLSDRASTTSCQQKFSGYFHSGGKKELVSDLLLCYRSEIENDDCINLEARTLWEDESWQTPHATCGNYVRRASARALFEFMVSSRNEERKGVMPEHTHCQRGAKRTVRAIQLH